MCAIAFDLVVAEAQAHHLKGVSQADSDIRTTLSGHGFDWVRVSLDTSKDEDLAKLFSAIAALKGLSWFPPSVRDLRAFRVEQWSDFTAFIRASGPTGIRRRLKPHCLTKTMDTHQGP